MPELKRYLPTIRDDNEGTTKLANDKHPSPQIYTGLFAARLDAPAGPYRDVSVHISVYVI